MGKDNYASRPLGKRIMFSCEKGILLSSVDGMQTMSEEVEELNSTQEEADTKITIHCLQIASNSSNESTPKNYVGAPCITCLYWL